MSSRYLETRKTFVVREVIIPLFFLSRGFETDFSSIATATLSGIVRVSDDFPFLARFAPLSFYQG